MPHVYAFAGHEHLARMTMPEITPQNRRSRMRRTSTGKRLELTQRDLEIFKLLARYRYLRSTYIRAFVGGNKTKLIERLGHLYHEGGYLDRPEQQWEAVNARYMPVAYELGERARWALDDLGLALPHRRDRARQYRHEAMVCEIVASIELESRAIPGIRFISWEEILRSAKIPAATLDSLNPRAISTRTRNSGAASSAGAPCETDLVPDALFGVEYETGGKKSFRFFALEADRNTEPMIRRDNRQSSYGRKIVQYEDVIRRALYRARWGLPNLLVLTVTTNERHLHALLQSVRQSAGAEIADHFLFRSVSRETIAGPIPNLLTAPWLRAGLEPLAVA